MDISEALSKWNFDSFVEKKFYLLHLSPFNGSCLFKCLICLSSYVKVIDLVDVSTFFFIVYAVVITC